jgi:hypothetical protein
MNGPFVVGAYNTGLNTIPERIDGVGFIKRLLTASEITALYNNGKGVKYAGLPATVSADATLSFWNLDEYSPGTANVTRNDSKGTNHLTSVGNTPSGQGVNYFEGVVSKWFDQSGNAKTMLQTTTSARLMYVTNAQNSKPVLRGDGLTKCLYNANDLIGTGNVTVFAVIKPRGWGGSGVGRIIDNNMLRLSVNLTSARLRVLSDGVYGTMAYSANSSIALDTAYVVVLTRTSAGVVNFYINGALSGVANQASGTPAAGSATYIGNLLAGTAGFDGDIDEVGIVNRILSDSDIQRVTTYLGVKWGITVTIPVLIPLLDETGTSLLDEVGNIIYTE